MLTQLQQIPASLQALAQQHDQAFIALSIKINTPPRNDPYWRE